MNELDKLRTETEARQPTGEPRPVTRYSDAVNRYLGVVNYCDLNVMPADIPAWQGIVTPKPAEARTRQRRAITGRCGLRKRGPSTGTELLGASVSLAANEWAGRAGPAQRR